MEDELRGARDSNNTNQNVQIEHPRNIDKINLQAAMGLMNDGVTFSRFRVSILFFLFVL
jgi:hypothetical protein